MSSLRSLAIYQRLRQRFPTFHVEVVVFDCGGTPKGEVSSTGQLLHWLITPYKLRGYVRGRSVASTAEGLEKTLGEAWRECRKWKDA